MSNKQSSLFYVIFLSATNICEWIKKETIKKETILMKSHFPREKYDNNEDFGHHCDK